MYENSININQIKTTPIKTNHRVISVKTSALDEMLISPVTKKKITTKTTNAKEYIKAPFFDLYPISSIY
jgi:hypothetical protein